MLSFLLVAALVLISWRFFDAGVARYADAILRSQPDLAAHTDHLPDLLLPFTLVVSLSAWAFYAYRIRSRGEDWHALFAKTVGAAVPLAYLLKFVLKHVFGRVNTRSWLLDPDSLMFHWFHGGGHYNGFPSGHMTVVTPLLVAVWHFYPRYRSVSLVLLVGLAWALVFTDYHFLSDVIAGIYAGTLVYCFVATRLAAAPHCRVNG